MLGKLTSVHGLHKAPSHTLIILVLQKCLNCCYPSLLSKSRNKGIQFSFIKLFLQWLYNWSVLPLVLR